MIVSALSTSRSNYEEPCFFVLSDEGIVLNENPNELLSAINYVKDSSDDDGGDDGPYEIFFAPDDADKLPAMFEAVRTCLSIYASMDFESELLILCI
ncbi:hypothetical protein TNCT_663941 [Trichonephila clavata]|uniref:Uncharacterized protein n=1 Tax=Trichonephila clavata TaxID=2740835 RepID=A0A8X6L3X3_TRICU|nr:hypothetical protein TNCT_663941 [Trichonephila clavata]